METEAKKAKERMWRVGLAFGLVAVSVGCAHQQTDLPDLPDMQEARRVSQVLLRDTNSVAGSVYLTRIYIVQKGDTVGRIAKTFGISIKALRELNPGLDPTRLWPGQRLRVGEEMIETRGRE